MNSERFYRRINLDTGLEQHLGIAEHLDQAYMVQVEETQNGAEIRYAETEDSVYSPSQETVKELDIGFEEDDTYQLEEFNGFEEGVEALADELEQQNTVDTEEALVY